MQSYCLYAHLHTMDSAPTRSPYNPMFLAYDCASSISRPASANMRMAAASVSREPDAKPWSLRCKTGMSQQPEKQEQHLQAHASKHADRSGIPVQRVGCETLVGVQSRKTRGAIVNSQKSQVLLGRQSDAGTGRRCRSPAHKPDAKLGSQGGGTLLASCQVMKHKR